MTEKGTDRMIVRVKALGAIKDALLPSFCDGQRCGTPCPFYNKDNDCLWLTTMDYIEQLQEKLG
jgi:hypothetical protein